MVLMRKSGHLAKTTSGTIHLAKCNPSCPCYDENDSTVKTLPFSTITCELLYGAVITPPGFVSQSCAGSVVYLGPPCETGSGIESAFLTATTTRCTTLNVAYSCYFLGFTYGGFSIALSYYPSQIFAKWESYSLYSTGVYVRSSITKVWQTRTNSGFNVCDFDQSPVTTVRCYTHPPTEPYNQTDINCSADITPANLFVPICDYVMSDIDLAFS